MAKITRSPRAPSFALDESVASAIKLYEANGKHSIPAEVAAKTLGYSGMNNGSAARALASLKSFGLLISNNKGDVAVSPDIETYQYAPDEGHRRDQLVRWLRAPKIYDELLNEYHDRLPSDQVIKYKLIKMGFLPNAAEECLKNFRSSVDFANYFSTRPEKEDALELGGEQWSGENDKPLTLLGHQNQQSFTGLTSLSLGTSPLLSSQTSRTPILQRPKIQGALEAVSDPFLALAPSEDFDRIPVRLSKGRRAWIQVPMPLYKADKEILINQINLILTDEEDGN